jgi:hypothetical protein
MPSNYGNFWQSIVNQVWYKSLWFATLERMRQAKPKHWDKTAGYAHATIWKIEQLSFFVDECEICWLSADRVTTGSYLSGLSVEALHLALRNCTGVTYHVQNTYSNRLKE